MRSDEGVLANVLKEGTCRIFPFGEENQVGGVGVFDHPVDPEAVILGCTGQIVKLKLPVYCLWAGRE
jgi:hypothetical protein